jgi:hypothetical protein
MDWILLDNKPFKKILTQQEEINKNIDSLNKKVVDLEKQNKNLENFLIHNQQLYLKHFNMICDILQENRQLYMKQFQNETQEIESLKPILNELNTKSTNKEEEREDKDSNMIARFNNLVWRSTQKKNDTYLTTPKINSNLLN